MTAIATPNAKIQKARIPVPVNQDLPGMEKLFATVRT